ncbi:tryptophan--tRNA ligase [Helicobacter baculiformis]|uniref:Tryptophan--tRNA ligase n=1 Tax=Helicobacter baculiformis TaxID=427351 RepID=A0ABV7ZMR2_9HELI|nr:tryptophan--tRNA ligase [Helicobacter baculiformis]
MKERVFSGIQPTGGMHLGNYLGAIKQWVDWQDRYEGIFCVVNAHALTTPQNPSALQEQSLQMATLLLACGIDPKRSKLFMQSQVNEHGALCWLLSCGVSMGDLARMTQFKDKSTKEKSPLAGLFTYPVLMAADILLYQTDCVPVGADQKQHLELTRHIALKFNRDFGECFKVPKPLIGDVGARVMGLDDPSVKMSKSHPGALHALFLLDEPDLIAKKIKKATTDSIGTLCFDPTRPGVYNLLNIYALLSQQESAQVEAQFEGKGYGDFKKALTEVVAETFKPIREAYTRLQAQRGYVASILQEGLEAVQPIAAQTYQHAKTLMGLL